MECSRKNNVSKPLDFSQVMAVLEFLFNRMEWEENEYMYYLLIEYKSPFEEAIKPVVNDMYRKVHELEMRGFQFDPPDEASWEAYESDLEVSPEWSVWV